MRLLAGLFLLLLPLRAEVVATDFESGFGPWVPLYSGTWELLEDGGTVVAALTVPGEDRLPIRRPRAYLFLPGHSWTDYTLTVESKTLEPTSLTFRDICLIFGYQDDTHYYYAHISSRSDSLHSIIMKVEDSTRATIHNEVSPTPALDGTWQTLRVTHAASGAIAVFVDDLDTPYLTATDTSYPAGAVAFGCFDDRALFDDVSVSGTRLPLPEPKASLSPGTQGGLSLDFATLAGFTYEVNSGPALPPLIDFGAPITGHGGIERVLIDPAATERAFFRVAVAHPLLAEEPSD